MCRFFSRKGVVKSSLLKLKSQIPKFPNFFAHVFTVTIREAIYDTQGSGNDKTFSKQSNTSDGNETNIGSTD